MGMLTVRLALIACALMQGLTGAQWTSLVRAADAPAQTLQQIGTTPLFAQSLTWLDQIHFAVGRWDGTISLFRMQHADESGPVATEAMTLPSGLAIEMLTAFDQRTLVSSNGTAALAVWQRPADATGGSGQGFQLAQQPAYDASYGTANSGLSFDIAKTHYLATGHANGWLLLWSLDASGSFVLAKAINIQSPDKPANPWGLRNVRGIALWRATTLVTGSEDGDVAGISLPDAKEVFRLRFNPIAQRGINSVSISGDWLLVANCSVGMMDKNIWLYNMATGTPQLSDAENLALDTFRSQTFDFDVDLFAAPQGLEFFSSTEEGIIWKGKIDNGQLTVTGVSKSSPEAGSAMAISPDGKYLAASTYALRVYALP